MTPMTAGAIVITMVTVEYSDHCELPWATMSYCEFPRATVTVAGETDKN